jgi:hypothetical protein
MKDDMSVRKRVASSWCEIEKTQMYKRRLPALSLTYYLCACTKTQKRKGGTRRINEGNIRSM